MMNNRDTPPGLLEKGGSGVNLEAGDAPSDIRVKPAPKHKESKLSARLEDQLTNEKLVRLQQIFEEADEDGGGGLDMDEFRGAMRQTMGSNVSDQDLDKIFMKVDTNCDGTVDWDEYLTYMLLECREKDQMQVEARQPFPRHLVNIESDHRDSVVSMLFVPHINPVDLISNHQQVKPDYTQGRYLSTGRDGILTFWSTDMKVLEQHRIESDSSASIWVTDCACLPSSSILALATTASNIIFYSIGRKFSKLIKITRLDYCPVTMSMTTNKLGLPTLLWGDDRGGICGLRFTAPAKLTAINPKTSKHGRERIPFAEFLAGQVKHIRAFVLRGIHGSGIRHIQYAEPIESFISCSRDTDTAMFVGDLDHKMNRTYFSVPRGINDFVYFKDLNVIITGGYDAIVRVWNPYVPTKPVVMLRGHQSPILRVHINPVKEHIISIGENKEIRVHDLNSQTCIQTFFRKMVTCLGPRIIFASVFQPHRQALVLATNKLALLEHHNEEVKHKQLMTHTKPLAAALYNPLFDQVVSAAADSLVCVWCLTSGQKVMQFKAHTRLQHGETRDVEITAITFDPTYRRLLTGSGDGVVKVWNFNNGCCLRDTQICSQHREITAVVCARQYIVVGGWNKEVVLMKDKTEDDDETLYKLRPKLSDDILSINFYSPSLIAAGTSDGLFYVWSLETHRLLLKADVTGQVISPCRMVVQSNDSMDTPGSQKIKHQTDQAIRNNRQDRLLPDITDVHSRHGSITNSGKTYLNTAAGKKPRFSLVMPGGVTHLMPEVPNEREVKDAHINELQVNLRKVLKQQRDFERRVSLRPGRNKKMYTTPNGPVLKDPDSIVAIEQLVFLSKREHSKETASLLCACSDGVVRAWSVHPDGGLLGSYYAAHGNESGVTAITTTEDNEFVITGDEMGYIRVWDVTHFCLQGKRCTPEADAERENTWLQFPFYKVQHRLKKNQGPPFLPPLTLCKTCDDDSSCHLVNSFRGHLMWINSLDVATVGDRVMILSASADCSVRIWTIQGQFLGIFGQDSLWDPSMLHIYGQKQTPSPIFTILPKSRYRSKVLLPPDIRRVGSAATLRVLFAHMPNPWMRTRALFSWIAGYTRRQTVAGETVEDTPPELKTLELEGDTPPRSDTSIASVGSDQLGCSEMCSNILGQSYKKVMCHRPLPTLSKPVVYGTHCAAYRCLPPCGTEVDKEPLPPENMQILTDIQHRYSLPAMRRASVVPLRHKIRSVAHGSRKDMHGASSHRRDSISQPAKVRHSNAEESLLALLKKAQKQVRKNATKGRIIRKLSQQASASGRRITLLATAPKQASKEARDSVPGTPREQTSLPQSRTKATGLLPITEK